MDISIVDAVNRELQNKAINEFESLDRDYTYFHASEWDKCHRQIAYHYYYAKGWISVDRSSLKIDPVSQRIFDNGHWMHDRWRLYLEKSGALMGVWVCEKCNTKHGDKEKLGVLKPSHCNICDHEKIHYEEISLFNEETWWGGHVDAVIDVELFRKYQLNLAFNGNIPENYQGTETNSYEDKYLLVDFKTINPRSYNDLTAPMSDHITQMQIYLFLTGLKYGKFIYEDKWTQNTKEYLVVRDDNLIAVKKEESFNLKYTLTHTNSQGLRVLPARAYQERTHRNCLQCQFRGHCWK